MLLKKFKHNLIDRWIFHYKLSRRQNIYYFCIFFQNQNSAIIILHTREFVSSSPTHNYKKKLRFVLDLQEKLAKIENTTHTPKTALMLQEYHFATTFPKAYAKFFCHHQTSSLNHSWNHINKMKKFPIIQYYRLSRILQQKIQCHKYHKSQDVYRNL